MRYQLMGNSKKTIIIELKIDYLVANLLGQDNVKLIFLTNKTFKFKSGIDIKGEFITDNGKVTKLIVDENGKYNGKKYN